MRLLNPDIPRTRFRLDGRAASVDGSGDVMLVQGASHGERKIRLNRARAGLRVEREMSVAAYLQGDVARTGLQLPWGGGLAADLQGAGARFCLDASLYVGQLDGAGAGAC